MEKEIKKAAKNTIRPALAQKAKKTTTNAEKPGAPAIKNEKDYNHLMAEIEKLVTAGGGTIRSEDLTKYSIMAGAAQEYEHRVYTIDPPKTLEGLLEWKMYELKLKQKGLARKLHVSDTKLSLVMSGRQRPDATLLKSIHKELGIDGNVLLSVV